MNKIFLTLLDYNSHFGLKKTGTHRDHLIFVIVPGLYMFRELNYRENVYQYMNIETLKNIHTQFKQRKPLVLDDFVVDMHTSQGRMNGMNSSVFATVGAHVENEDTSLLNETYRKIYIDIRKNSQIKQPEIDESEVSEVEIDESTKSETLINEDKSVQKGEYKLPVSKLPDDILNKLKTVPYGQKPTSLYKPIVYMFPDFVIKGPYKHHRYQQVVLTEFRREVFNFWGDITSGPFTYFMNGTDIYMQMPIICDKNTNGKTLVSEETKVLGRDVPVSIADKDQYGIIELHKYLESNPNDLEIAYKAMLHYLHRYLIDPIVGDAALRNVLVVNKKVIGIDFEENRGNTPENADTIKLLSGGSRWGAKYTKIFSECLKSPDRFREHLKFIEDNISHVDDLINKYSLRNVSKIENILKRCKCIYI